MSMEIFAPAKIDSLLVQIPLFIDKDNDRQILFINRQPYVLIDLESGDVLDDFKHRAIKQKYNNFDFYYQYEIFKNPKTRIEKHSLNLLVSSKLQGYYYFNGVDKKLIYNVIQYLIDIDIIKLNNISIENILKFSIVKDIDICQDYLFKMSEISAIYEGYKLLSEQYKVTKNLNKGISIYPKLKKETDINSIRVKNLGLVVNVRKGSTVANPHVKNYSKTHDLMFSKTEIYNVLGERMQNYISENLIIRHEITLLNNKFFKHFELRNTFDFWFNLSTEKMIEIFARVNKEYSINIFDNKTNIKNTDEIKPTDLVLLRLIEIIDNSIEKTDNRFINILTQVLKKNKIDLSKYHKTDILYYTLLEVFTQGFEGSQKTRQLQKVNELFRLKKIYSNKKFRLHNENKNIVKYKAFEMFNIAH